MIRILLIICIWLMLFSSSAWAAKIFISWTDNSTNEQGFKIERREGTTILSLAQVGPNVESFVDSTVLVDIQYCYRVLAYNAAGVSAWSGEACITPVAPVDGAPSGTTVIQVVTVP